MALYRWGTESPFNEIARLQNEMSRLMRGVSSTQHSAGLPPVNVYDDGDNFHVRAELAGLDKDKLDLQVAGDVLTIKAERVQDEIEGSYHRRERGWDHFNRSMTLPDTIDVDSVRATYKNGVLEVELPRAPESRPRKVSIEG